MKSYHFAFVSLAAAGIAVGGPFQFNSQSDPPDVLIGLRQSGSASEILADIGPITRYTQATPGSSFLVTELSPAEILKWFPVLDDLRIDVFAAVFNPSPAPGNPTYRTLWLGNPRTDPSTQSIPWSRKLATTQGTTASRISSIGSNAVTYSRTEPDGPDNDGNVIVMASDSNLGYSQNMGPIGTFKQTFYSDTELTVPSDFAAAGVPARIDFYELVPYVNGQTNRQGNFIGYFEFGTNATLRFQAPGGAAPAPSITEITRNGSVNTITFTTASGPYQYVLLRAPVAGPGAPLSAWTVVGPGVPGTGNPASLTETTDAEEAFYRIRVSP